MDRLKLAVVLAPVALVAVIAAALALFLPSVGQTAEPTAGAPAEPPPRPDVSTLPAGVTAGTVTGVVDGDTIDISGKRYRLSLVDTPERGEPGFAEAAAEVEQLCPAGSAAYYDGDDITPFDRYGRHLGVVWCEGNDYTMSVGEHLWRAGLAEFYHQFCGTSGAATITWAAVHGWFYYDMCSRPGG